MALNTLKVQKLSFRQWGRGTQRLAIVATLFAVVGVGQLLLSRAATPTASLESETGTKGTNAVTEIDTSASGSSYVRFTQPQTGGDALLVNANTEINPFNRKMKGIALANWTFTKGWNKPFVGELQQLPQAIRAIDPGLIRYAGGLWVNSVGFDRTKTQITAYTNWNLNGNTYAFSYGTDELASVDSFAKSVNAEVMIQVNVNANDPNMWADLVRYAKERNFTSFKYYEFGNEFDLETFNGKGITPAVYASRVAAYQTAMLAVDPTIKFVGGVPATASDIMRQGYAGGGNQVSPYITQSLQSARAAGKDLDSVSYHWYQTDGSATAASDVAVWSHGFTPSSADFWRQSYSREWSGQVPAWIQSTALSNYPTVQQGLSELGINSADGKFMNGNHMGALWYSDILGRLAYNGVDWATQWDSYAHVDESFSLLYPSSEFATNATIFARPTYYAYLMYNKYFGDRMVQSTTYDPSKLSIWASKDTDDPGKLKLRITNMTGSAITAPIRLNGFSGSTAGAYIMSSTNPTDMSANSDKASAPTTINGVSINGNNVAASLASIQPQNIGVNNGTITYTFPAYSSVAIVVNGN